jgi:hypothetical protein
LIFIGGEVQVLPNFTNVQFTFDNFMPFVTKMNVELNDDLLYAERRDQCEGADNTLNDGYITRHPEIAYIEQTIGASSQLTVKIETSEQMTQMTFQIAHAVLQFLVVTMNATNQDSTNWEASLSDSNLRQLEGQCAQNWQRLCFTTGF